MIKKFLFITMWLVIVGGMLTLLIAAIGKQKRDHCKDYVISINGAQKNFFVNEKDVIKTLKTAAKGEIKGQKKSALNLQKMEQLLRKDVWVKNAELYFDNREVLHVSITEREPIARIFTLAGKSYYLDEEKKRMPLSEKMTAKVPVFTGFPEKVLGKRDSVLLENVRNTALFILNNNFWMAQVAQIDIDEDRDFEMIPVVGNHTVLLGDGEHIDRKFRRLFIFYKNILSKTGFEKYRTINVQYAGQVIGVKGSNVKSDTARLRMNVEKLLQQAREMQDDSLVAQRIIKEQRSIQVDPSIAAVNNTILDDGVNDQADKNNNPVPVTDPVLMTDPVPMKPLLNAKSESNKGKATQEEAKKRVPKAVMKPRAVNGQ